MSRLYRVAQTIEKYALLEAESLSDFRQEVESLEKTLERAQHQKNSRILVEYFRQRVAAKQRFSERVFRRLERWNKRLIENGKDLAPPYRGRVTIDFFQLRSIRANLIRILARGGELYKLVAQPNPNWQEVENKINEAMGDSQNLGLRSLLLVLRDLESICIANEQPERKPLVLEHFLIPWAYTFITDPSSINSNNLRYLSINGHHYYFSFDETEATFKTFLKKCSKDTNLLQKHLQREATRRGFPIWCFLKRKPNSKKHFRRMIFYIRPLYFGTVSGTVLDETNRMQWSDEFDQLVLHFDESHNFQAMRNHNSTISTLSTFRGALRLMFEQNKELSETLSREYGHWDLMAKSILDALELMVKEYQPFRRLFNLEE